MSEPSSKKVFDFNFERTENHEEMTEREVSVCVCVCVLRQMSYYHLVSDVIVIYQPYF